MQFGISTHLFHDHRLQREHLAAIAAQGFDSIELFATRSHFDYHDAGAIGALGEWLRQTGLRLHSIHAPITDRFAGGSWTASFSTASADAARRGRALQETRLALEIARHLPAGLLVIHLGVPGPGDVPHDNRRQAALLTLQELEPLATTLGVRLALEVIPNELSTAASLVRLLEEELELPNAGICLDFGHACLMGDPVEAVETVSGHLITTHVHDNDGRRDSHLPPFEGCIDWEAALVAMQKIGYEGTLLFELAGTGSPLDVLAAAARARNRFERMLEGP